MDAPDHLYIYKRELLLRILRKSTALLELCDDDKPIPYRVIEAAIKQAFEASEYSVNSIRSSEALLGAYTLMRKAQNEHDTLRKVG